MAGSKWTKSQNGSRVKMGYCCLPPERVELTGTARKKQMTGSKWAKSQDELLWLKPAVKPVESSLAKRSQLGPESSWAWPILTRSQTGPRSQYGSEQNYKIKM